MGLIEAGDNILKSAKWRLSRYGNECLPETCYSLHNCMRFYLQSVLDCKSKESYNFYNIEDALNKLSDLGIELPNEKLSDNAKVFTEWRSYGNIRGNVTVEPKVVKTAFETCAELQLWARDIVKAG